MRIEPVATDHRGYRALRAKLWPDVREDEQIAAGVALHLVAFGDAGDAIGFAEGRIRTDFVNGCETSPVLFLEGLYVEAAWRRQGIARSLCDLVASWGRDGGCAEFASDALLDNAASHAVHEALGFTETERVVYFRKPI